MLEAGCGLPGAPMGSAKGKPCILKFVSLTIEMTLSLRSSLPYRIAPLRAGGEKFSLARAGTVLLASIARIDGLLASIACLHRPRRSLMLKYLSHALARQGSQLP